MIIIFIFYYYYYSHSHFCVILKTLMHGIFLEAESSVNKFVHFHHLQLTLVFTNTELIEEKQYYVRNVLLFCFCLSTWQKTNFLWLFDAMSTIYGWLSNRTHATLLLSYYLAHSTCFLRTAKLHGLFQNCKRIEKWIIWFFTVFFYYITQ